MSWLQRLKTHQSISEVSETLPEPIELKVIEVEQAANDGEHIVKYIPMDDRKTCQLCGNLKIWSGGSRCACTNRNIAVWFSPDELDLPLRCAGFIEGRYD